MQQHAQILGTVPVPVVSHANVYGTSINVHVFGAGSPWKAGDFNDYYIAYSGSIVDRVSPIASAYGLSRSIVPDLRGFTHAFVGRTEFEHLAMPQRRMVYKTRNAVDGLMLRRGFSVFMLTADCHMVLMIDPLRQQVAALHGGRDALHPLGRDGTQKDTDSLIYEACRRLLPTNLSQCRVMILCGIGPTHFTNSDKTGGSEFHNEVVEYFVQKHGTSIIEGPVKEGRLNIPLIIKQQLIDCGIREEPPLLAFSDQVQTPYPPNIQHDGIDTYSDRRFHSRRHAPLSTGMNCVLIDMEHAFEKK
jgi:copper oxidase (laccase) domain-containing protein